MIKNLNKRYYFQRLEIDNLILKTLFNNKILNMISRTSAAQNRYFNKKNSSITVIRKNCIKTGRNRGVILRLSRFKFKSWTSLGVFTGIRKC